MLMHTIRLWVSVLITFTTLFTLKIIFIVYTCVALSTDGVGVQRVLLLTDGIKVVVNVNVLTNELLV